MVILLIFVCGLSFYFGYELGYSKNLEKKNRKEADELGQKLVKDMFGNIVECSGLKIPAPSSKPIAENQVPFRLSGPSEEK